MADIPPELLEHMLQTRDTLGRIEANQKNTFGYLQAVDNKLTTHIADKGAHGLGEQEISDKKSDRKWNTWSTTVMAAGAFADLIWRMFHKSGRGP